MKWMLLCCVLCAVPAFGKDTSKYILNDSAQSLVFLDNYPTSGVPSLVVFAYYEAFPQFSDYLFVSVMRADCSVPNRLQTTQSSAAHITYGIAKDIPPLSDSERMWRTYAVGSIEARTWNAVCHPDKREKRFVWRGSAGDLLNAYQRLRQMERSS